MKYILCILVLYLVKVDCGLLKDALTPVTEAAQNNAALNEYEHKEKDPKKKGLVTNLVEGLDSGVDSLTKLLTPGKSKDNAGEKKETDKKGDSGDKDTQKPEIDVTGKNTTDKTNNTLEANKLNETKVDEVKKDVEDKKEDLESSTPGADLSTVTAKECKDEECIKKLQNGTDTTTEVGVERRVNFDGSQCPTGMQRAHDNTCKEIV